MKRVILSLGGSIVVPEKINVSYLKKFRALILDLVKKGYSFVIVVGGGKTARNYMDAASKVTSTSPTDLDWVGIKATAVNSELVRSVFGAKAYSEVVVNPTKPPKTSKPVIVACGWKPGCSTDKDAALLAKGLKSQLILNLSNIDFVYDKDPRKSKNAKAQKRMTWKELLKVTGSKWTPGLNAPFDPEASKLCQKYNIDVIVLNGTKLDNLKKCLTRKPFRGTIISH